MIRQARLLLLAGAALSWAGSRLTWVSVRSFDGLGPPRDSALTGAAWSTALLPLAVLLAAAALAALAVRGWLLRAVAAVVAAACLVLGYLGISLMVMPDVGPRGAALAGVPVADLVGSDRHVWGAVLTLVAAGCALVAAGMLMRASTATAPPERYAAPRTGTDRTDGSELSERGMWDALDSGRDPTDADSEGR